MSVTVINTKKERRKERKTDQKVDYKPMAMGHRIVSIVGRGVPLPAGPPLAHRARPAGRPYAVCPWSERACM
jgi:hypothetical protein